MQKELLDMSSKIIKRCFCTFRKDICYKLVIIGGGTGGATMASRLRSILGSKNIVVIEPSEIHYYQPLWTLVGAGLKKFESSYRSTHSILPKGIDWIKDEVVMINAASNNLETRNGIKVSYDYLIIATGLKLAFEKIKGFPEAFETTGVCSNYSPTTVKKTYETIQNFQDGNAVFTQPINPIKCAGAPQKIMYLADDIFRKKNVRKNAKIFFFTALETIFSVPKYATALEEVANSKDICVNYNHNLIEIKPKEKIAIFQKTKDTSTVSIEYEMLHVTPPMIAPDVISNSALSDSSGFLNVDKYTLQHKMYSNIFGIGDCTNLPISKTAAAIAGQCGVLTCNILSLIKGDDLLSKYNGYTSCPLLTGNKKAILAEFDYNFQPLETLPIDQSKELYSSYIMKKDIIPFIYWNMMLKGYWNGPAILRKVFHLGLK